MDRQTRLVRSIKRPHTSPALPVLCVTELFPPLLTILVGYSTTLFLPSNRIRKLLVSWRGSRFGFVSRPA
jgi:hypothetical protein